MKRSDIKKRTEYFIKDLHARECMRMGWYRQWNGNEKLRELRVRKATHTAFLHELLRKRNLSPVWYARFFYYLGHLFGWFTAMLPTSWAEKLEKTLEFWILLRYKQYLKSLQLDQSVRTMVEALQLHKLNHSEPGEDVIVMLQKFIQEQENPVSLT